MSSESPLYITSNINSFVSCGAAAEGQGRNNYSDHWYLDQIEPENKKENKYKISGEWDEMFLVTSLFFRPYINYRNININLPASYPNKKLSRIA